MRTQIENSFFEKVIYTIFIISVILLGAVFIGSFSIRVYATIIMLLYLILRRKTNVIYNDKNSFIGIYIIFVLLMGLSLYMNGEFLEYEFIKNVLAYYLIAIISYYATKSVTRYETNIDFINSIFVLILFITSIVTILQYYNNAIGWYIASVFGDLKEALQSQIKNKSDDSFLGTSSCVGIMRSSFTNAMYISTLGVISFGQFFASNKLLSKVYFLLVSLLGLVACFMTQQRSAFYCMIFAYIILPFYKHKFKYILVILLVVLPTLLFYLDFTFMYDKAMLGRLSLENIVLDDARIFLWTNAVDFIENNFFWGGPVLFKNTYGLPPHNFFLNAFIYAGFFGGLVVIYLFFKIFIFLLYNTSSNFSNFQRKFLSLALIIFLIQGLVHNESLVSGSSLIFILLALVQNSLNVISREGRDKQSFLPLYNYT